MKFKFILLLLLSHLAVFHLYAQKISSQNNMEALQNNFLGFYSNSSQVEADSTYLFSTIHFIRIWPKQKISTWIYCEQIIQKNRIDSNIKQIFELFKMNDTTMVLQPYNIDNKLINSKTNKFDLNAKFNKNNLIRKNGCAVFIHFDKITNNFLGETHGIDCVNLTNEPTIARLEMKINNRQLIWWEMLFDKLGNQIGGNPKGGFIFNKTTK